MIVTVVVIRIGNAYREIGNTDGFDRRGGTGSTGEVLLEKRLDDRGNLDTGKTQNAGLGLKHGAEVVRTGRRFLAGDDGRVLAQRRKRRTGGSAGHGRGRKLRRLGDGSRTTRRRGRGGGPSIVLEKITLAQAPFPRSPIAALEGCRGTARCGRRRTRKRARRT